MNNGYNRKKMPGFGWLLGVNNGYSRQKMLGFGWFLGANNGYTEDKRSFGLASFWALIMVE